MEGFCRGCLNTFDDPVELLQYTEERRRLFVYSTGIQVKRNDAFTFQLCKECHFSLKTSCKFKKMCRTSDKKIKSYLALKDVDEGMDFETFLKRNEDSLTFRLPLLSGGSTPANQKAKDDDNESTCTSIQNFMTDILRAEEIPDSEARIIRQVIEEEADVLEDTLDSHWLEEDISDDEFRLNLSLSRFSTPRSTNNDRMSSPCRKEVTSTDITSGEDYDNIPIDVAVKKLSNSMGSSFVVNNVTDVDVENETKKMRCVIDKNLEKALKDENNKEFSLEELLASPVFPSKSGASTPTIKQIIFGDKVKPNKKTKSPKFESDLDLLMGKLDKCQKSKSELHKGKFNLEAGTGTGKFSEGKYELGMKHNVKSDKGNQESGKGIQGKKINLGKYSAGKLLQEKLELSKGKLHEEKIALSKSQKIFKGQLGDMYEEKFDLENFNIGKDKDVASNLVNANDENRNDGKLDVDIEMLLEDQNVIEPDNANANNNADEIQMELFGEPGVEFYGDDSDDDILEEFLNAEKEKLAHVEMKKRAVTNLINAAQMNDAELTELLQEAYDYNVDSMKGKRFSKTQSPDKAEKMLSPIENKYCVTNFYCKMCSKKFKDLKALKIHFAKRHKYKFAKQKKPWEVRVKMCDLCGRSFTNTKSLVRHLQNHNKPKEYSCEKCKLTFKNENALNHHKVTHSIKIDTVKPKKNFNDKNGVYVCKICGAVSTSSSNHILHERRHSKTYTVHCDYCGKGFYRTTELNIHVRRHTGEKPFSCLHCESRFARRDGLNRHMKCHLDEKMYTCVYCNRKYVTNHELKQHHKIHKSWVQLGEN